MTFHRLTGGTLEARSRNCVTPSFNEDQDFHAFAEALHDCPAFDGSPGAVVRLCQRMCIARHSVGSKACIAQLATQIYGTLNLPWSLLATPKACPGAAF